ncbi:hypothetical protein BH23GEM6_BH23GEM6_15690 [soil metagenome]
MSRASNGSVQQADPRPLTRRSAAILLTVFVSMFSAACDALPTEARRPGILYEQSDVIVQEAVQLMNAHRATLGCETLEWHARGALVGERYAQQMNNEAFFGHVDSQGRTLKTRLNTAGISGYRVAAETIAAGQTTSRRVVEAWLKSPEHRAILEDCRYTRLGLGFYNGSGPYRVYWTAVFLN